jgi:tRNA1Val (adenine37-N6)-methyltransferase
MGNSYFQLKQFRIEQGDCAMKVTTDACIQGAWTTANPTPQRILDIGAGTGLLSLMMAQKYPEAIIDAVELDTEAATQAESNFKASAWAGNMQVFCTDISHYTTAEKYELIITNPPFFNNSLQGPELKRNLARHTGTLGYQQLFEAINLHLSTNGIASVLLPRPESASLEQIINENGWHIHRTLHIKDNDNAAVKRVVFLFGRQTPLQRHGQILVIKENNGDYTSVFKQLLGPYYLHL